MASVNFTDATHVALYDDTRMRAFGPIFPTQEHAEDFLDWATDRRGLDPRELRRLNPGTLDRLHELWRELRCDDDGYLLTIR